MLTTVESMPPSLASPREGPSPVELARLSQPNELRSPWDTEWVLEACLAFGIFVAARKSCGPQCMFKKVFEAPGGCLSADIGAHLSRQAAHGSPHTVAFGSYTGFVVLPGSLMFWNQWI